MKILEITTLYPKGDNAVRATEFLHEYNKELVADDKNDVRVIFLSRKYPALFKYAKSILRYVPGINKIVASYSADTHEKTDGVYFQDAIKVLELTIRKYIPHGEFPGFEISRAKKLIKAYLKEENFDPDVVILDFLSPCALVADLFPNAKILLVPHYTDLSYVKKNKQYISISRNADAIMYRSPMQRKLFEAEDIRSGDYFEILSGVPEKAIHETAPSKNVRRFMTACRLIKEKNVQSVIAALEKCQCQDWEYTIVGSGELYDELQQYIQARNLQDKCHLVGFKKKDEVFALMQSHDCFVMPSVKETFGMVYIEAMANRCIPVGSIGEGIDGVIVHGQNGFLVDPTNVDALTTQLDALMAMDEAAVCSMSDNCVKTAKDLTNENLARSLMAFLTKICAKESTNQE